MASMGYLRLKGITAGADGHFTVTPDSVASFPIGQPSFTSTLSYPEVGSTTYSTTNGLGITSTTTPSEAVSKVDSWLEVYLLNPPPALTLSTSTSSAEELTVTWTNPTQRKLAFHSAYIPQIDQIKADIVPSASNSDQSWSSASAFTLTLETVSTTPTVTSLRIVLDYTRGTSNLTGGVYTHYGTSSATRITSGTAYDIRVYAVNEAVTVAGKTPNYMTVYDIQTTAVGMPGAPTGLTASSITSITALAQWTAGTRDSTSSATPLFSQYQVNVTATASGRYGGVLTNHTATQQTVATAGSDAPTQLSLTTLNPSTTYSITVQAKNALSSSFGSASSPTTFTTSLPTAPSWPTTGISLTNQASLIYETASAYTLNGSNLRALVLKESALASTNPRTASYSSTRLNNTVSDTSATIGSIEAYAGPTSSESKASVTTVGFGRSFTAPQTIDNSDVRLHVASEGDYYTASSGSGGFYKAATVYAEALSTSTTTYVNSDSPYNMYLKFIPTGGSTVTTNTLTFYIDGLNALPSVSQAGITGASSTTTYVTGVPTFTSSTTFTFAATISNLAYRFLRTDLKHLTAQIETSGSSLCSTATNILKSSIDGTTHFYYTAPSPDYAKSTTKHNTSGTQLQVNADSIQFNTFTIVLSGASSLFNEALQLRVTPYNLQGAGSAVVTSGYLSTTDGSTQPIRIDTASVSALASLNGTLMTAGSGQYPSSGYTTTYDHEASIVSSDQLQMVNGRWTSAGVGSGYKDYTGYYFPVGVTAYDYSGIASSGWRYTNLRFQNLKSSGTYDGITITYSSSGLTLDLSADDASNFRLYIKVINSSTSSTTPWLSGLASINAVGWGAITSNGQGCADSSRSTSGSIRCYVPTATPAGSTIYVRFGLNMAANQWVSGINCVNS